MTSRRKSRDALGFSHLSYLKLTYYTYMSKVVRPKEQSISGGERSRTDDPLLAKQVL